MRVLGCACFFFFMCCVCCRVVRVVRVVRVRVRLLACVHVTFGRQLSCGRREGGGLTTVWLSLRELLVMSCVDVGGGGGGVAREGLFYFFGYDRSQPLLLLSGK